MAGATGGPIVNTTIASCGLLLATPDTLMLALYIPWTRAVVVMFIVRVAGAVLPLRLPPSHAGQITGCGGQLLLPGLMASPPSVPAPTLVTLIVRGPGFGPNCGTPRRTTEGVRAMTGPVGALPTTLITAVPLRPSLVAVIVSTPAPSPVTRPLDVLQVYDVVRWTDATPGLLLAHVTGRHGSGPPAESSVVATSCRVPPIGTVAVSGATLTDATGASCCRTANTPSQPGADTPPTVAVMVVWPSASAVTSPFAESLATAGTWLDHVTAWPMISAPAVSVATAVSCSMEPTATSAVSGRTLTVATGPTVVVPVVNTTLSAAGSCWPSRPRINGVTTS